MYKMMSKILVAMILITSISSTIPVFAMDRNLNVLPVNTVSKSEQVYLSSIGALLTTTNIVADDHGNDCDSATNMEIDIEMEAVGEKSGDFDFFKFTPKCAGMYSIESTGTCYVWGDIYNPSKSMITSDRSAGIDSNFYFAVWLEPNETYYLSTRSYKIGVPYKVRVNPLFDDCGHDNNSASELVLDTEVAGEINFTKDIDYFKFTPSVSGPYVMEGIGNIDVDAILYGCLENIYYNKNFRIPYTLEANKTYYLQVFHSKQDKDLTSTGKYGVKVTSITDDYGNTFETAEQIKVGEEIKVVKESGGDNDYFKFTAQTEGMYSIKSIDDFISSYDTTAIIYNSNKTRITHDNDSGRNSNFYCALWLNANETCYIQTNSRTFDKYYIIKVSLLKDDYGNDKESATELFSGKEVSGEINYTNDIDYFKFTPSTSEPYLIESTGSTDVDGTLFNLASYEDVGSDNGNFSLIYSLEANKTYYIQVNHNKNGDEDYLATGAYGIKVSPLGDDHGIDFDTATEIEAGDEIQAVGQYDEDYDYFKFTPDIDGMYSIESSGTGDVSAFIYDNEKDKITYNSGSGIGYNFYLVLLLNANKTYYIKTYPNSINVPYTVKVNLLDDDHGHDNSSATEIEVDKEVMGEINYTKDIDYFKFTPAKTGSYSIESTGNTRLNGTIYNLTSQSDVVRIDRNFRIVYTLNAGETYYIQVEHADLGDKDRDNIGAYGIKISQLTDDHGNSFDTATEVNSGDEVQAVKESEGDIDYFKFTPVTSGIYCFESTGDNDIWGELYTGINSPIYTYGDGGTNNNFYTDLYMEANKTYYLKTNAIKKNVPYFVKAYPVDRDDHGNDIKSSTDLSIGDEVSGAIDYFRDADCFVFTTEEGGSYRIESSGNADVEGYLVDHTSNSNISNENKNFRIDIKLDANTTYYLRVYHSNYTDKDDEYTGAYKIKLIKLTDTKGDIDGNGSFNSIDFGYMRMYLLGTKKDFTSKQIEEADVDNNGTVNSIDFGIMRQVLLGMKTNF